MIFVRIKLNYSRNTKPGLMKKTFFLPALLLLLSFCAFNTAQAQEGVKIGFRASPLIGWASIVDDSTKTKPEGLTTKPGIGFSFDFVFTYGFSESVGLRTGINIATKGVRTDYSLTVLDITTTAETKTSFTAIEIPLGLKFRSPEIGSGMYIVGHFGVNPEINLQNKTKSTVTVSSPAGSTSTTSETVDSDDINLFTFSFVPGAGVDWEFDWGMLEMALTYHWGLLSYTDTNSTGQRSRLNYIALNLGYFF